MTLRTQRSFCAEPSAVAAARSFLCDSLEDLEAEALAPIELMVSELASNCVRHVGMRFDLVVIRADGEVRCEVTDHGYGTPVRRPLDPREPSGRGLAIVDLLSRAWGVDDHDGTGKTVWFTVAEPRHGVPRARTACSPTDRADRRRALADRRDVGRDRNRRSSIRV